jgi:ABC-type nitrate/sulfonate/bicarbonate transport system substrate-binding protein
MNKLMRLKNRWLPEAVLIAVFIFSFFFPPEIHAETAVKTLRIGYVPLISQLPLVVSYDNDRLNYTRVNVTLVRYGSLNSLEAAFRVEAIDIADLPVPVVFDMSGEGIQIRILGQYHSGGSVFEGVGSNDLSDFKGKIIGVPGLRSIENLEVIRLLSEKNLRYGLDYKTIKVPLNTLLHNLKTARINAMYFPEPYGFLAERDQQTLMVKRPEKDGSQNITTMLVAKSNILQKDHKEAVTEWICSLRDACVFIEQDITSLSGEQTAIIQEPYFGFDRAVVSSSLSKRRGQIRFVFTTPEKHVLQLYLQRAMEQKIISKPVDIANLLSFNVFSWKDKGRPSQ